MSESEKTAVDKAQEYYNSNDADNFYFTIWGGEDIHVGLYQSEDEPIFDASRRTVERMASKINNLNKNSKILDIGAGYGGAARYLARNYGCQVVALNLSEVENERDSKMNEEQALDHLITVVDGSFENLPYPDDSFDVVWSQDSILHSNEREQVIKEVARVLKSGGDFIFTDPMQTDDCPEGVLQPILDRIHLESLGSPGFYRKSAKKYGMKEMEFEEHTSQLPTHYGRVLKETKRREDELSKVVSQEYINNMKQGLQHWVNGGNSGYLTWGIFHFSKE
ncbi:class I SAM-dependent methyltransferase [Methanohalobium sp.]|uniref:class I SAM-dependent methyltransferase n=1 Tax=Methanohalobium sp. TaxID=2837493 RepID=UPI0025EBA782|nr:class I SAM-dependent methyltransferase [Methanohalobium sp.]